ncbi:MAG: DEAD/DEAH box helicase [Rectinemataceae bacterium]|nr:DEAD/DEAH box helicase [Rectinemataceae bacterium]
MVDETAKNSLLRLSPAGHLRPVAGITDFPSSGVQKTVVAFGSSEAAGLFGLAAHPANGGLPPELVWWRDFAARYLTERCHTPAGVTVIEPVAPLPEAEIMSLLLGAPPMEGAEYLTSEILNRLWSSLDEWVVSEAAAAGGFEDFLSAQAPLWRQVGRVCFHLAENRKDPDFPFAFLATYAPRLAQSSQVRYQPLAKALQEFAGERNRKALVHLLTPIHNAAGKSAIIRDLLESNDIYHPLAWTAEEAYRFLGEIPLFEESGVLVRVPDWWAKRPRPRVTVSIGSKARGLLGAASMLDFDVGVALGDETLTEKELKEILAGGAGLFLLKGKWVEVDPDRLSEALAHWKKVEKRVGADGISFVEGMRLLAGAPVDLGSTEKESVRQWSFVDSGSWLKDTLASLRSPAAIEAVKPGAELLATLRHYQESGLRWLWLLSRMGLGACLADDMGLGKTIQVLALLLLVKKESAKESVKESARKPAKAAAKETSEEAAENAVKAAQNPSLLVLPASLLANWKAEMERFTPSLRARFVHPSMTPKGSACSDAAGAVAGTAAGAVAGDPGLVDLRDVDLVVTTYGMLLRQPWIESAAWNLVILDEAQAIKNPGSRQTKAVKKLRARARIALTGTPVENRLSDLWSLFDFLCPGLLGSSTRFKEFAAAMEKREGERYAPLRNLVGPYILRRLKTDRAVIADLPDKTEVRAFCGLSKSQAALYRSVVTDLEESLRSTQGIARKGIILSTLMKLKQVCNHPAQLSGDGDWDPASSGKFTRLAEICEEIASRQDRVLVFTQFREMTAPVADFLAGIFGREGLVLHGGTPVKERRKLVESFQEEDGPPFFVLSLKAGGTGLNLTAASHVIHFDRWWNPAVENQATDRAFRIGQKKNVLVHKFVCQGTIEEKIDELIGEKSALAMDLLEGGTEAALTGMTDAQLLATVSLDLDRAQSGF